MITLLTIIILTIIILSCLVTIEQQQIGLVERFGKFNRLLNSGLNFRIPLIEFVNEINLRLRELNVEVDTKTKDNVFVKLMVSVQYQVLPEKVYEAYYKMVAVEKQMSSFVFDVVRAQVPRLILDDVFEKKDEIAIAVATELTEIMGGFGYVIFKALVTDIAPDKKVVEAMNEINASLRLKEAAVNKGESEKIIIVKKAEAEAESKRLQGEGIANQRLAIVKGLKESIENFQKGIPDTSSGEIMNLVILTQYFDTLKEMGAEKVVLIPHSPASIKDISTQIRDSIIVGNEVIKKK